MKKISILLGVVLLVTSVFNSCRKDDNEKLPDLIEVPLLIMVPDATSDAFISRTNPETFTAKFSAQLLFPTGTKPQKADIVVMKNGDVGNVKTVKTDITSFPTAVEITGQQLIDQFGPIAEGDQFDFGFDITSKDGQTIPAFSSTGNNLGSGLVTEIENVDPTAALSLQFLMPCEFVASAYDGDFEVLGDEWNDYPAGTVIPVTVISATEISFEYNNDPGTAQPIILKIDPATNAITVDPQEYGEYGGDLYSAESVPGPASQVNPCDVSLSIRLHHTVEGEDVGNFTIALKKK